MTDTPTKQKLFNLFEFEYYYDGYSVFDIFENVTFLTSFGPWREGQTVVYLRMDKEACVLEEYPEGDSVVPTAQAPFALILRS